jgi:uroporphyrinogen decarboxylase
MLSHRELIQTIIEGDRPDRPGIALWRHFPVDDQQAETLAAATIHFQQSYDFDIVKVTPASSFAVRDWGVQDQWMGDTEGTRRYVKYVINQPGDWERLHPLDPTSPHLAGQLACLRLIRRTLGPETPVIQTVFNPLSQAKNLAGNETLMDHLRKHPDAVLKGLETITQTTLKFIDAVISEGADGIFYAIQHAQSHLLSLEEYEDFGTKSDQILIQSAGDLKFNMLHLHGTGIHFPLSRSLGIPIVNWHDRETPPTLAEGLHEFNGVACGGLRQDTLVYKNPATIKEEGLEAIAQTLGRRFILGTGCVVPIIAPHGNLLTARKLVEDISLFH